MRSRKNGTPGTSVSSGWMSRPIARLASAERNCRHSGGGPRQRGCASRPYTRLDWRDLHPGASIDRVLAILHDYDNYERMYRPIVTSSNTLACTADRQEFEMLWQAKILCVSAAMQGHYQAHDIMLDAHRGYSIEEAVEVREIERFGHADRRLLAPGASNGFIWRIRSIARYEERDGGVYLELEAMTLSRDIPSSLAWYSRTGLLPNRWRPPRVRLPIGARRRLQVSWILAEGR